MGAKRSITLTSPEVRALLRDGQARALLPIRPRPFGNHVYRDINGQWWQSMERYDDHGARSIRSAWTPGELLWVRETWLELHESHWRAPLQRKEALIAWPGVPCINAISYRADTSVEGDRIRAEYGYRWLSASRMPRWASRITVEVVSVASGQLFDQWVWVVELVSEARACRSEAEKVRRVKR